MQKIKTIITGIPDFTSVMRFRSILLAAFFFLNLNCFAQQPSYFLLGENQFEGVQIYDVIQDDSMNYWIATDNGIYKYDSYSFTRVECNGAQALSAFGFVKNNTGTIYCYNLNNQILQIKNGECSLFYELKAKERSSDIYLSITTQNELLILTKTALLFSEDGKQISIPKIRPNYYGFPFQTNSGQTISHIANSDSVLVYENRKIKIVELQNKSGQINGVLKFFSLSGKTFAISTAGKEIYAFDETNYSITLQSPTELQKNPESLRIYNENNQVWIAGVISGVRVLSENGSLNLSEKYYQQYLISDVYQDMEGNLLVSTFNHGILVIPNVSIPDVLSLPDNYSPVSIHTDNELGMLMGTLTGQLLSFKDGTYTTLSNSGSRPLQSVYSWTNFPFVLFDDGNIKALHKTSGEIIQLTMGSLKDATLVDGNTFYLAMNRGVCKVVVDGGNKFECQIIETLRQRCYAIAFSPTDNNIYVATAAGVKVMSPDGKVNDLQWNNKTVFANDIVFNDGSVYLATKDGVIGCSYGKANFLIPTIVQDKTVEILKMEIQNNRISCITPSGFVVFDMKGNVLIQLNRMHGFSTNRIYDFENSGNEIWICHSKGIQNIITENLLVPISKPLINIRSVNVNDREIGSLLQKGDYTSEERKFKFLFSSPTLRNKENIRYHYKLTGYDDTWQTAEFSNHEVVYNALAPGNYTFLLKAENRGVFSDPVQYSFSIAYPLYLRWWFILICGGVFIFTVVFLYRYQLNIQRRKARIINELNLSKLTAIQSQMNPHFIFNSLNSIQDLVLKGDVDNSYSFITKFSNLIRRTLTYSDREFIEFEQEIKLLELYLSLEKLRFGDELNFEIDSENIEDILIPPMLIQPFIENALIHGLLHREGEKKMSIRFELGETLKCIIEDNGVGRARAKEIKTRQRSEHESFSGNAIKKRFSILSYRFKEELGFKYEDLMENGLPSGTRVTLSIPVKHKF